jgi:hypothetical protein
MRNVATDTTSKQTPWSESASELYRPSDRRLSAKLMTTFADRGCYVVSVTDPYSRILGFLGRNRYFSFKYLLTCTHEAEWYNGLIITHMFVTMYITITILDIFHRPVLYLKSNVPETGFCLRLQDPMSGDRLAEDGRRQNPVSGTLLFK